MKPKKALVRRAAAFLDQKFPGWHRKVNIKDLNLNSSVNCVTGQMRSRGVDIRVDELPLYVQEATLWHIGRNYTSIDHVEEPWKDEIRARRKRIPVAS